MLAVAVVAERAKPCLTSVLVAPVVARARG